ncbi:uncharacterized protein MELLADRAFT_86297 [Melampsora larici-populina 98AG31]|uniref:FAD-binding FR-type domain-containing protein n=1 Tax=Melampsora larici-populina (strain 98AG31 / pathotype 3-4-7) TaxID=747676 RepID=F4RL87_MELLP|nr:uncharacterized protein MELLADRAFT_86297 [Melampsora larici-populina 98AG31]EGG06865.1 hypothetical protein MELLADRAFT_86297 [Melampsora larici-populina 98AG31]
MMEFIKQIHENSLTSFILGSDSQSRTTESDPEHQLWYLDYQTESISSLLSSYLQSCQPNAGSDIGYKPISIHFSSLIEFEYLQSDFIDLIINSNTIHPIPIHLHLPLNSQTQSQEHSIAILNFYQSINHLNLGNSCVIYFSGHQLNKSNLIKFSYVLGKLGCHLLHVYDQTESIQSIKPNQNQNQNQTIQSSGSTSALTDELEQWINIHKSNPHSIKEILDKSLFIFSPETHSSNESFNPYFRYTGSESPTDLYILFNSFTSSQLKHTIQRLLPQEIKQKLGLIEIKVFKPWSFDWFLKALPPSTQTIRIFSTSSDLLFNLISKGKSDHKRLEGVDILPFLKTDQLDSLKWIEQIQTDLNIHGSKIKGFPRRLDQAEKLIIFWDLLPSTTHNPPHLSNRIASSTQSNLILNEYDNSSDSNSIRRHSLYISNNQDDISMKSIIQTCSPTLLVIENFKQINKTYDLFTKIEPTTNILFISSHSTDFKKTKLDLQTRYKLWKTYSNHQDIGNGKVCELKWVESLGCGKDVVVEIGVMVLLFNELNDEEIFQRIRTQHGKEETNKMITQELVAKVRSQIRIIQIPDLWQPEDSNELPSLKKLPNKPEEILNPSTQPITSRPQNPLLPNPMTSNLLKKQIMFPEFYQTNFVTRSDLTDPTYLLKVIENKRLTPQEYDRNVFHLSLSLQSSELRYSVGDAVGIYAWNIDEIEIRSFIKWLKFSEDQVIEMRFGNESEPQRNQYMTIFKSFQQVLDLFGKPNQLFFDKLSKKLTNKDEQKKYAKSLDPLFGFDDLVDMVPRIRPRHYSIASSYHYQPEILDLCIVEVNWKTSFRGSGGGHEEVERIGLCTGYLNQLKIGDSVLVCLKESVMRLPKEVCQPIILAGLGTGMAPFRAFLQERAFQRHVLGLEIGPVLYYFGSRSKVSEFLYGDEIEEYLSQGIITHSRLSFTRDLEPDLSKEPKVLRKKEYIQDLMRLDQDLIIQYLMKSNGHFYLCGPVWPVGEVYQVLLNGIVTELKKEREEREREREREEEEVEGLRILGMDVLERLKDQERYVLEVY